MKPVKDPKSAAAEYHDEYSETLGTEFRKLQDALLSDQVSILASEEPIRLEETALSGQALEVLLANDRAAVMIVDAAGRLAGIVTDRDLLRRLESFGADRGRERLSDVMTRDPQTLRPDDRICYAVNRMMALGCRTLPIVDGEGRPIGLVTVDDIAKWLATLFPEAILNLRPGDRLKRPAQRDGG